MLGRGRNLSRSVEANAEALEWWLAAEVPGRRNWKVRKDALWMGRRDPHTHTLIRGLDRLYSRRVLISDISAYLSGT